MFIFRNNINENDESGEWRKRNGPRLHLNEITFPLTELL